MHNLRGNYRKGTKAPCQMMKGMRKEIFQNPEKLNEWKGENPWKSRTEQENEIDRI